MKFNFSTEQEEFRSNLRRRLAERSPSKEVRRLMETEAGWERDGWRKLNSELGLTALRVTAPLAVILALVAAPATSAPKALLAVTGTAVAAWLAFTPAVGYRFVNGAAYGEERRYPLRVPPALVLGTAGHSEAAIARAVERMAAAFAGKPV